MWQTATVKKSTNHKSNEYARIDYMESTTYQVQIIQIDANELMREMCTWVFLRCTLLFISPHHHNHHCYRSYPPSQYHLKLVPSMPFTLHSFTALPFVLFRSSYLWHLFSHINTYPPTAMRYTNKRITQAEPPQLRQLDEQNKNLVGENEKRQ